MKKTPGSNSSIQIRIQTIFSQGSKPEKLIWTNDNKVNLQKAESFKR
jgi:hypothetical protein